MTVEFDFNFVPGLPVPAANGPILDALSCRIGAPP